MFGTAARPRVTNVMPVLSRCYLPTGVAAFCCHAQIELGNVLEAQLIYFIKQK